MYIPLYTHARALRRHPALLVGAARAVRSCLYGNPDEHAATCCNLQVTP